MNLFYKLWLFERGQSEQIILQERKIDPCLLNTSVKRSQDEIPNGERHGSQSGKIQTAAGLNPDGAAEVRGDAMDDFNLSD